MVFAFTVAPGIRVHATSAGVRVTGGPRAAMAGLQAQLDGQWPQLLANDPGTVFAALSGAFAASRAPAAVTGVENGEASVVVIAPATGVAVICSHALMAAREALAAAPGLRAVRVAVVRPAVPSASRTRPAQCLLAVQFTRQRLHDVGWHNGTAVQIVQDTCSDLRVRPSGVGEPLPLDLAGEPALAALLHAVGTGEGDPPAGMAVPGGRRDGTARSPRPRMGSAPPPHPPVAPALHPVPGPAWGTRALAPVPARGNRAAGRVMTKPRYVALVALGAVALLLITVMTSSHGTTAPPAVSASAVATNSPAHTSPAHTAPAHTARQATGTKADAKKAPPGKTASPAAAARPPMTATPAVTRSTPAATPSSHAAVPAAASCTPLSDENTCYKPGEFCRDTDHGVSGIGSDGEPITCEDNDGWRWEAS